MRHITYKRQQMNHRLFSLTQKISRYNEVMSSKCRSKIIQPRILYPTKLSFKSLRKSRNFSDT